jgi:hypothetical protein
MSHTVEVSDAAETFAPVGEVLSVRNHSGTLTAVIGQRTPTADGYGQVIFFWDGTTFLGWDASRESTSIVGLKDDGAGGIAATFAHYAPTDAACCPSLHPATVTYALVGGRLQSSGDPPPDLGNPIQIVRGPNFPLSNAD